MESITQITQQKVLPMFPVYLLPMFPVAHEVQTWYIGNR